MRAGRRGWPPTPPSLDALGCRTDAVRATLLAAELRVRLGDLDGADALLRLAAPSRPLDGRPPAVRARGSGPSSSRPAATGPARGEPSTSGVRLLADHQAVLGAIELRRLRRGEQRRAWPASASGWRSRTVGRESCSPSSRRRAARRRSLPAARPPDDDVLADLLARLRLVDGQQRDAAPERRAPGRARRRAPGARAADPRPRPPRAGRRHPGRRAARRSRCGCSATGSSRVRQPRRRPVRRVGRRQPGRRCTSWDRSTGWRPESTAASTACTASTGSRARRPHGRRRPRRSRPSPRRWPNACSRRGCRAFGPTGGDRPDRGPPRPAVGRAARPPRAARVGHPVAHGLGDRPPARRQRSSGWPSSPGPACARRRARSPRSPRCTPAPRCWSAGRDGRRVPAARSGAATSSTSPATARTAATTRCSPRCRLADGPLTVFDLERCPAMPRDRRAVGLQRRHGHVAQRRVAARAGQLADDVRRRRPWSPRSLRSPTRRSSPVMTRFHEALAAGHDPAEALAVAAAPTTAGSTRRPRRSSTIGA